MPLDCTPPRGDGRPDRPATYRISLEEAHAATQFMVRPGIERVMHNIQTWRAETCRHGHTHIVFWSLPGAERHLYEALWQVMGDKETIEGDGWMVIKEIITLPTPREMLDTLNEWLKAQGNDRQS